MAADSAHPSGYEKRDAAVGRIIVITLISVVVVVIIVVALYNYFLATKEAIVSEQFLKPVSADLLELRRAEDSILNTYNLIDPANRTYSVPIVRAMELLAEDSTGT